MRQAEGLAFWYEFWLCSASISPEGYPAYLDVISKVVPKIWALTNSAMSVVWWQRVRTRVLSCSEWWKGFRDRNGGVVEGGSQSCLRLWLNQESLVEGESREVESRRSLDDMRASSQD
jgi:hypothetical protein